jgi:zinc protease
VTVADVNRVAAQRLLRDNRTLAIYEPTEQPHRAPTPEAVDVVAQMREFHAVETLAQVAAFDATPANIEARTHRSQIAPGLKVALLPKEARGKVVIASLVLQMGDEASLRGQESVAEMMASLFDKGSVDMSRQQLQDRLTALKAEVSFGGGTTRLEARMVTTSENLPAVIELTGKMLRQPAFPADALEELRRGALSGIEASRKEPQAVLAVALARHGNPYPRGDVRHARSFDEEVDDLKRVTVDQVKAFHQRFVGVAKAQFGAVGAMDEMAVKVALDKAFAGWAAPAPVQRVVNPLVPVAATLLAIETPDKQNASLSAALALPLKELDDDQAALMLADFAFGSGGNSRLWKRVREAEGLSYGVGSRIAWNPLDANSAWGINAIFAPQNRAKVEAAVREELDRSLKDGFSATEIEQARAGLLNFRRLSRAQDGALAGALASNLYLDRTFAVAEALDRRLAAVTAEQATAAWRKYIEPGRLVLGVAGDFKGR